MKTKRWDSIPDSGYFCFVDDDDVIVNAQVLQDSQVLMELWVSLATPE